MTATCMALQQQHFALHWNTSPNGTLKTRAIRNATSKDWEYLPVSHHQQSSLTRLEREYQHVQAAFAKIRLMDSRRSESQMKATTHRFGVAVALIGLLLLTGLVPAQEQVRIDASSDKSVEQSYERMVKSLDYDHQIKLQTAIIQLNLAGVSSAREMLANPELRNPGPVRIKDRIAGLSAGEIIALAANVATIKVIMPGEEPGVPANLVTPLEAGKPTHALASTRWHLVENTNGFIKEKTFKLEPGGKLETIPPFKADVSTWEQSANEVRFFINDRYAVSRGIFVDADHMRGTGGNKMGTTWTWTAERK